MTEPITPYEDYKPGEIIAAERMDTMQVKIKKDIAEQVGKVQKALDEHAQAPVDAAKFGGKTPDEWVDNLDKRYAPLNHDHEGVRRYQRYFLELETVLAGPPNRLQPAVLIHDMGRNPLTQVYQLLALPIDPAPAPAGKAFKFCYSGPPHASDPEAANFKTKSWDERHWGDPLDAIIAELARALDPEKQKALMAKFQKNFTLAAWLANLEEYLFEPGPAQYHFDMGDVYQTKWVRDRLGMTAGKLEEQGEWPPRLVYRPALVDTGNEVGDSPPIIPPLIVRVFHLNVNEIEIAPVTNLETHLMVVLRS